MSAILPTFTLEEVKDGVRRAEVLAAYRDDAVSLVESIKAQVEELAHGDTAEIDENGGIHLAESDCHVSSLMLGIGYMLQYHTLCALTGFGEDDGMIAQAVPYLSHAAEHGDVFCNLLRVYPTGQAAAAAIYDMLGDDFIVALGEYQQDEESN